MNAPFIHEHPPYGLRSLVCVFSLVLTKPLRPGLLFKQSEVETAHLENIFVVPGDESGGKHADGSTRPHFHRLQAGC